MSDSIATNSQQFVGQVSPPATASELNPTTSELANTDASAATIEASAPPAAAALPLPFKNEPAFGVKDPSAGKQEQAEQDKGPSASPNPAAEAATRKALDKLRKMKEDATNGLIPNVKPTEGDEAEAILAKAAADFISSSENKAAGPEPVRKAIIGNKRDAPERAQDVKRQRSDRPTEEFGKKVAARSDRFGVNARENHGRSGPLPRHQQHPNDAPRSGRRSPPSQSPARSSFRPEERPSPRTYDARPVRPPGPPARDDRRPYDDRPPFDARPAFDDRRPPPVRTYPDPAAARRDDYGPPGAYRGPPEDRYRPEERPPFRPEEYRGYRPPSPPRAAAPYRPLSPVPRGPPGAARRPPSPPQPYRDPRGYEMPRDGPYSRDYAPPAPPLMPRIGPAVTESRYGGAYVDPRPAPAGYDGHFRDERPPARVDDRRPYDRDPYPGAYTPPHAFDDRGPPAPYYDRYAPPVAPPIASELDYLKQRMAELERMASAPPPPPAPTLRERISVGRNTRFNPDGPPAVVSRTLSPPPRRDDDPYYGRPSVPPQRRPQETRGGR